MPNLARVLRCAAIAASVGCCHAALAGDYGLSVLLDDLHSPRQLAFAPDGARLVGLLQGDAGVRIWELERLRQRCEELRVGW
jgi:hypothetical protein